MRFPFVILLLVLLSSVGFSATAIGACAYTISAAGDYYVSGNLACTGNGITINANVDNVNIDLNGKIVDGDDGSADTGIKVQSGDDNITIYNGTINDFGKGIWAFSNTAANYNLTIANLTINSSETGLFINAPSTYVYDNISIYNSTFQNGPGGHEAIVLTGVSATYSVTNVKVYNNTFFKNGATHLSVHDYASVSAWNNDFSGTGTGVEAYANTLFVNLTNNVFHNSTANSGIYWHSGNATSVFNNNFFYAVDNPIYSTTAMNLTNLAIGASSTNGIINWSSVNLTGTVNIDNTTNIYTDNGFVSIDSANIPLLNNSAVITMTNPSCLAKIYVKTGFPTTAADISLNGADSGITPTSCSNSIMKFSVPSFSGYAPGYYVELINATANASQGSTNISQIFNVTFYDESSGGNISIDSASMSYTITNSTLTDNSTKNYSIAYSGTINNASIRAFPNWANATIDGIESYAKSGYTTRSRFVVNANTNLSQLQNIQIYLLNSSSASYGLITVVNKGSGVGGAYVSILKYFSSSSTYTQIDQKVTNGNGQAAAYIEAISYYKFAVYDADGTLLYYSTAPEQFICTSSGCGITIDISDLVPFSMLTPYASASCYGNNTSNSIVYAYADGTGQTTSINFLAYRENQSAPVCNNTITAATGAWTCSLNGSENLSQYLYSCEVWRTASPAKLEIVDLIDFRTLIGIVDWIFPAMVIITTLGVSAFSLPLGIGLGGASLFVLSVMGVVSIPYTTSIPIMIVGLVIAFLLSKRGGD